MSSLNDAPIIVLFLVLNNLDQQSDLYQCALVNKTFYATANPLLWREPQLVASGTLRRDTICSRLKQSFRQTDEHCVHSTPLGHNVRKLNISHKTFLQDLHSVINNVPLVEELVIGVQRLKYQDMIRIALNCPQLKCLSCTSTSYFTGSEWLFHPLRHCANLREFSMVGIFNYKQLLAYLQHCQLEKLKLHCPCAEDDFSKDTFFGGIPTLTHLDIKCKTGDLFRYCWAQPSLTLFPVLTDLRITTGEKYGIFDNKYAVLLVKAHPFIRALSLKYMKIDPAFLASLATDFIHLQRLSLIKNGDLPPFTKAFHRVEKLTLRGSSMITQSLDMYFPNLHYIHADKTLKFWRYDDDISHTDGPVIETLTKLIYLDFASYDSVPSNLKVHLPRRMGGQLVKEDLDHIRETALGLVWIE
ncbi:hypothetical protein [Absidia glauca]|uniref:F-box domain-containing protein n=1 Tax=Absidia glauca TaxID=4829 RepID=A0A168LY14_ABSGL|nr:hypothetical protein [Absidia glauca]